MIVRLVAMVWVAYMVSSRSRITARGIIAFALAAAGVLAVMDGFMLGVQEDGRARYGRVTSGVVIEMFSSTGADGSRRIGPSGGRNQRVTRPVVTADGFAFYDSIARLITTGTPAAWVVDYRYPCRDGGTCTGRDFVTREYWSRLNVGMPVNVRQADWEKATSRLDENSRWATALIELAIGGVLLFASGVVSNRIVLFRHRWLTAPAVVTAIESVQYGDDVRWRIRFAYFDRNGVPQESADQVVPGAWKTGDSCVAVYLPEKPDLATLQPAAH